VAAAIGWLIAGRVLRPLSTITAAARRISASSLHERLALPGPDDELRELVDTLDCLFARLEASFDAQRRFAASASHELRTPLTRERERHALPNRRPSHQRIHGDARSTQRRTSSRNTRSARPVRGRPWKADGYADRPGGPDAVRYMSVDTATQGPTALQGVGFEPT
jgi:signal transduction histidine kinase